MMVRGFFGFGALCQAGRCVNVPAKKSPAFGREALERWVEVVKGVEDEAV